MYQILIAMAVFLTAFWSQILDHHQCAVYETEHGIFTACLEKVSVDETGFFPYCDVNIYSGENHSPENIFQEIHLDPVYSTFPETDEIPWIQCWIHAGNPQVELLNYDENAEDTGNKTLLRIFTMSEPEPHEVENFLYLPLVIR